MAEWLNLYQTWAWIAFRDRLTAEGIDDLTSSRAARSYYPNGDYREWPAGAHEPDANVLLQQELERGRLTAYRLNGIREEMVPTLFWAEHKCWRAPESLRVERREVERLWPAIDADRLGRPIEIEWPKVRELAEKHLKQRPSLRQTKLSQVVHEDCKSKKPELKLKRAPSERSIRRKLKEWGLPPGQN